MAKIERLVEYVMSIDLFAPFKIGELELRNRFMRSATYDGTADDAGAVTQRSLDLYKELANGHIGLIVTGHAYISRLGQAGAGQYGIYDDALIPGLQKLTTAVHQEGGKIAVQIAHAGINSNYLERQGIPALAVSASTEAQRPHKEMSDATIETLISEFVAAAQRAVTAGFDAVQIHGAHGYLMSQFLSPLTNFRKDRWGGSAKKRRTFHHEVVTRVREAIPKGVPLLIKFGVKDDQENGLSIDEGLATARQLAADGIDGIEVSGGIGMTSVAKGEAYFRDRAAAVKRVVPVPVMEVAGIRSVTTAQSIVDSGDADMISMSRPFIREPGLILRWEQDANDAKCISCSRCFAFTRHGLLLCGQDHRIPD